MVQKSCGLWISWTLFGFLTSTTARPSVSSCEVTARPEGRGNCPVPSPHMNSLLFGNESHYFPALTGGSQRIYMIVQDKKNHLRTTDPPHLEQCLHAKDIRLAVPFTPGDPIDLMNVYACHGHADCTHPGDCGGECCSKICTYVINATACVGLVPTVIVPTVKVLTPGEKEVIITAAVIVVLAVLIVASCWRYCRWTRTALPKEIIIQCHPNVYKMELYRSLKQYNQPDVQGRPIQLPMNIKVRKDQSLCLLFFKILFRWPSIYLVVFPRGNPFVSRLGICGFVCRCCFKSTRYECFCNLAKMLASKRGFRVVEDSRSCQINGVYTENLTSRQANHEQTNPERHPSNQAPTNQERQDNQVSANQEQQANQDLANQEHQANQDSANQEHQDNQDSASQEPQDNLNSANQEPQANQDSANQEPQANQDPANQEPQANQDPANQEHQANQDSANQEPQANQDSANQEPQANQDSANQEPQANQDPANQETQANQYPANQEPQANQDSANQEHQANHAPANQRGLFDVRSLSNWLVELQWVRSEDMAVIVGELNLMCNRPAVTELDSLSTIQNRHDVNRRNLRLHHHEEAHQLLSTGP